ncbi:MAG TPA: hypothetical protein PKA05_00135 [Roseiflexaceae bacterium]|nr:hypothetical protein [Roseiflexaceae bacterium]HMP38765.1 hypothetical protein [Roseiflexaceae bacterium]
MREMLPEILLAASVALTLWLLPRLNDERPPPEQQRTTEELRIAAERTARKR